MSVWTRIPRALRALASGETLAALFDRARTPPERSVAFTIAVIALAAKMAKADGQVKPGEIAAFREVFTIPEGEEKNAARVFDLARKDVAGFETYARRIAAMFPPQDPVLVDLMEGLFHVAVADGDYHPDEETFLERVAEIFGIEPHCFRALRARFVGDAAPDPYDVLGVAHDAPLDEVRAAWRAAVRDSHPDRMIARGVPPEAVKLAEARLRAVNEAWREISSARVA